MSLRADVYVRRAAGASWLRAWWDALVFEATWLVSVVACATIGHSLVCSHVDPESGSEDLLCRRCGWSVSVHHN